MDTTSESFAHEWGRRLEPAEVHQAAGMLSVQLEVDVATALTRLRAYALATDRALVEVAYDLLDRRLRLYPLPAQRGHPAPPGAAPPR